ncbi:diguanylate cyclase [Duganella sp. Leaf126]|uniref:sensor domain-containing diguanylate cyclase n=1 Tax=Duganella sp. Leaf126 TaxID=1736266 RepID=UPI0006F235CA|nr:sensor domain-containing diguanylate cyclase [Duganella sp. Leaf126]KQQ33384.1 diguanylate cyclase [Duganella sp. Leaf126]
MDSDTSLDLLHSVLNAVTLGAVVLDQDRRIVLWNDWMHRHAQLPPQQALGADFLALFPALRGTRVDAAIDQALRHHFPSLLSQSLNKAPFPLYASAAAARADERLQQAVAITPVDVRGAPRHCLIQISDVSIAVGREKLLREQTLVLRSQTFADGLTGIANRRHFDVAIEREHRRARRQGAPLSLLMIDIDHFKAYNDHYGHQKGDQCLIQVAAALSAMLKRSADLMARYGGEEFAMILPDTDADQARQMAEAIRARAQALAIAHAHTNDAGHGVVTVSIGVATRSAESPVDIDTLIGHADRALYRAKKNGRNRVEAQPSPSRTQCY